MTVTQFLADPLAIMKSSTYLMFTMLHATAPRVFLNMTRQSVSR